MNIEELTIKEIRQITALISNEKKPNNAMLKRFIGKYVIVRSRNEGINAGFVEDLDDTGVIIKDARRIWYHKPNDKKSAWYEGVANSGLSNDSKISVSVSEKIIVEDYSLTICSDESKDSIINHPSHGQN